MSKQLRLDVAQLTDVGRKRPHNEDNMAYVIPKDSQVMAKKGALFIVADGMGGHAAGEVASEIAVDTISNVYYQDDSDDIPLSLMNAIKRANALIHQRAAENMMRSGMGTTCVAAVLRGGVAYIANVGDSRAYIVRSGQSKQISQDHSWVEEQVRAGLLTKEQARSHAQKNVITRCLGTQSEVEVDVFPEVLLEGDTFVLCSDGLSNQVFEDELRAIINQYVPSESVYHLVERANENGGSDNITAIVVRVLELGDDPPGALHPVHAGSMNYVADESTAVLGRIPSASLGTTTASRVEEGRSPNRPLNTTSEQSFPAPGHASPAEAAVTVPRAKRSRLLFPTLAICFLLIVALAGSGYYFFLRPIGAQNVLDQVSSKINAAKSESASNPEQALQDLGQAQEKLRIAKGESLTSAQSTQYQQLQSSLTSEAEHAIGSYNQQAAITSLPCVGSATPVLSGGPTLLTTTMVTDSANHAQTYALGSDNALYHVTSNGNALSATKVVVKTSDSILLLASDAQHVYALTSAVSKNQATQSYTLRSYTADQNGNLNEVANTIPGVPVDRAHGLSPQLMTAWNGDIYIVTTSTQASQAGIVYYRSDRLSDQPKEGSFSFSGRLVSIAALPNNQLFLLHSDGTVKSVTFSTNKPVESAVTLDGVVRAPWLLDNQKIAAGASIADAAPTPDMSKFVSITSLPPAAQQQPQAFLSSGVVDKTNHLYLVDNINHRVLDFSVNGPTAANATQGKAVGGNVIFSSVSVKLARQYASPMTLPSVKSVALDPTSNHLNVLAADAKTTSQVTIDVSSATSCQPSS